MEYSFDKFVDRKGANSIKWEFASIGVEVEGYERINVACTCDTLKKCLDKLKRVLEG